MRVRSWFPVVVVAVLAAGCSGDDEPSAADTTAPPTTAASTTPPATTPATIAPTTTAPATTAPPTTAPATTAPPTTAPATSAPADPLAAVAEGALLTLDDFAPGWTEVPAADDTDDTDDAEDAEATALISDCAGVDALLIDEDVMGTARAESPGFTTSDETFAVEQIAGFAPDEATAAASAAAIADPDVPRCYGEGIVAFFERSAGSADAADTLPPGMELGEVSSFVGDLTAFDLRSQDALWFHVRFDLVLEGRTFEQHGDFVFLRNGAALTWLNLTGFGAPFPVEDIRPIVEAADAKLAAIA